MAKGKSGLTTTTAAPPAPHAVSIKKASEAKSFGELQKYAKDQLGLKVGYTLHDANFELVKDAVSAIEAVADEFPQAKSAFKWLAGNEKKPDAFASASLAGGIDLNGKKYKDEKALEKTYKKNVENHFHPEGTTVKDITSHEAGHILERALIIKKYGDVHSFNAIIAWNTSELSKEIISQACKDAKKTAAGKGFVNSVLIYQVSKYAGKNKSECLAECVADYMANGNKAKPLSIAVWAQLKKELG